MEVKKSDKANLEDKKLIFREIGFVVILGILLAAFNFGVEESNKEITREGIISEDDMEMVEVTRDEQQPEPEQPKPELPEPPPAENIEETEDETLDNSNLIQANNDDQNAKVEEPPIDFGGEEEVEETPFMKVEKMPAFPGGNKALLEFIGRNLVYPQEAADLGVQGTVMIQFVVGKDGKAKNPKVINSANAMLDKAALDIISKLPTFTPGEQAGEKVPVYYMLPIQFQLR